VRSSHLERKLVFGVAVLFVLPTLVAGGILLWLTHAGVFATNPEALAVTLVLGCVTQFIYLAVVARWLGKSLVTDLQTIRLGAELMATVNPQHRLAIRTGDEMQALAEEINRMADRLQHARTGLESEVARATQELAVERRKLSAVLESLGEGVVVATAEGRVSLANAAAQELLRAGGASLLGRNLFDLLDRGKVGHFVARLRAAGSGIERFSLEPEGGAVLEAVMTPYFDGGRQMIGFILVLRDVTHTARGAEARQRLFASTLWDLRGPVASIRSLSESLLGSMPVMAAGDMGRRLLEAIHAEALRLSGLVKDMGEPGRFGVGRALAHFETITVGDLAAMTVRRLAHEGVAPASVEVDTRTLASVQLKAEVSALSAALARLLHIVLERADSDGAWLRPERRGTALQLEAGARGRATLSELEACLDHPGGGGGELTVRDVVRRHAGEVWGASGDGRIAFRVTLPTEPPPGADAAEAPEMVRFVGAGTRSASHAGDAGERPDFYDFSLLEEMARSLRPADLARRLDELTYAVFDTETTGLSLEEGDRIISIAAVKVRNAAVKRGETFDALVNPGRAIPAESVRYHGITDAMVAGAPPFDVVLSAFLRFAEHAVLVAHQAWFDLRFLNDHALRFGLPSLTVGRPALDTVLLSEVVHGPLRRHGLETMAERFNVPLEGRHSALGDALTTAEIFVRLLGLLEKRGIVTLGQTIDATRRARDPSAVP
jgi:DNA polymerase III subunit epsilon